MFFFLETGCSHWLTDPIGTFKSPNKGSHESPCTWIIESLDQREKNITITIQILDNSKENCDKSNGITIYDQKSGDTDWTKNEIKKEMKEHCQKHQLIPISIHTRRVLIIYYSSEKFPFGEFNVTYRISNRQGKNSHIVIYFYIFVLKFAFSDQIKTISIPNKSGNTLCPFITFYALLFKLDYYSELSDINNASKTLTKEKSV